MSKPYSIITDDMEHCLISGNTTVALHHCFEGTGNRHVSDTDGLLVPLEPKRHNEGGRPEPGVNCDVHHCMNMKILMHIIGQQAWMMNYIIENYGLPFDNIKEEAKDAFRASYNKSWL